MMKVSVSVFVVCAILSILYTGGADAATCDEEFRCYDHEINNMINAQITEELTAHYTYLYMAQLFDQHKMNLPKVAKYFRKKSAEELTHADKFIEYQNQRGGSVDMLPVRRYQRGSCAIVTDVKTAFLCAMELEAYVTKKLTALHRDAANLVLTRSVEGVITCNGVAQIPSDDLRFTQPLLITMKKTVDKGLPTQNVTQQVISDYKLCECATTENKCETTAISFNYVELADMIVHDFLHHQTEDTKEIANHYKTLKKMFEGKGPNDSTRLESWLFDQHLEL